MNLDSLYFSLSQIKYLIANLNKKNYKLSVQEINHVSTLLPASWFRHLIHHCYYCPFVGPKSLHRSLEILAPISKSLILDISIFHSHWNEGNALYGKASSDLWTLIQEVNHWDRI